VVLRSLGHQPFHISYSNLSHVFHLLGSRLFNVVAIGLEAEGTVDSEAHADKQSGTEHDKEDDDGFGEYVFGGIALYKWCGMYCEGVEEDEKYGRGGCRSLHGGSVVGGWCGNGCTGLVEMELVSVWMITKSRRDWCLYY
jgi:hypothetical protein